MKNKYFTIRERVQLETMLKDNISKKDCAIRLNKSLKTIYNEIERGTVELLNARDWKTYTVYLADVAQRKYDEKCKNKGISHKATSNKEYLSFLEDMIINKKYSPYAIVQYMKNNDITFGCDLCEKSIYNYVYRGFIRVKKEQMLSPRHNRKQLNRRKVNYNAMKFPSIEQRPNCANERDEFGHWEIDTVYSGKGTSKACLLTLTERMTRIEESYLLPDRTAKSIVNVFNFIEKEVGFEAFTKRYKTLTSDNGVEFKDFINICLSPYTGKPRTEQYFTHPYSSYERGTNENHNRMIRRFIPKGMDLFKLTQKQIDDIVDYINNYPRRMFGGLSSKQYYEKHVLGSLVT